MRLRVVDERALSHCLSLDLLRVTCVEVWVQATSPFVKAFLSLCILGGSFFMDAFMQHSIFSSTKLQVLFKDTPLFDPSHKLVASMMVSNE